MGYLFSDGFLIAKSLDVGLSLHMNIFDIRQKQEILNDGFTNIVFMINGRVNDKVRPFEINDSISDAVTMLILKNTLKEVKEEMQNSNN